MTLAEFEGAKPSHTPLIVYFHAPQYPAQQLGLNTADQKKKIG
jgi:hypothetical protein